ncbi:hypothetical protein Tco_1544758, partial [Tanacetum coccineum]
MVKPEIGGNVNFKIKCQFMSIFNILGVSHDAIMLRVFLITLIGAVKILVDRLPLGTMNTWDMLKSNSRKVSNGALDGIAAIANKLERLGRDMSKLKENVHAIHVGFETYRGAHLDKECPLHEEVKSVEEVKYGEFGRSFP